MTVSVDILQGIAEKLKDEALAEKGEIIDMINEAMDQEHELNAKKILRVMMNKTYNGQPYTTENYLEVYNWGMTKIKVAKRTGKITGGKIYIDCWKLIDPWSLQRANEKGDSFLGSFKLKQWADEAHIIWAKWILGPAIEIFLETAFLIHIEELNEWLASGIERTGDDAAYKYVGWRRYYLNQIIDVHEPGKDPTGFEQAMFHHRGFKPRQKQQNLKAWWYS